MQTTIRRMLSLLLALTMLLGLLPAAVSAQSTDQTALYDLRVNDLIAPVGIDDPAPAFSWKMRSDAIGAAQTAYAITVTDGETAVWDTDWVENSRSVGILYDGEALKASTEYTVTVRVKDQNGAETAPIQTTFETGLMEEGFGKAAFISYDEACPAISDATVYNIEYDVTMKEPIGTVPACGFCFGVQDSGNLLMWQIRVYNGAIQLRPHVKTNNSWSAHSGSDINITEAMASIGVTPENIVGKTLRVKIAVNGTTFTTSIGTSAADLVQVQTYTRSAAVPLGNVGFRSDDDVAVFDNVVITDAKGGPIYTESFTQQPLLMELLGTAAGYTVADGGLEIGSSNETLVVLKDRSVSDLTSYTLDFDFIIKNKNMGLCIGVEGTNDLVMWQLNLEDSQSRSRFRPHFRTAGGWNTKIGMYLAGEQRPTSYFLNQLAHMRIVVDGSKFTAYVGHSEDAMTTLFADKDFAETGWASIPLKNIGFRAINNEVCYYDNIIVRDLAGNLIYEEDFSSTPALNALSQNGNDTAVVDEQTGMLCVTSTGSKESYWILYNGAEESSSLPAFRKSFTPEKEVVSARLYTSGLGVYDSYINGQRVGRRMEDGSVQYDELKPGFTEHAVRKFYNTYDVTWMLKEGENVLSALVSGGWWTGSAGGSDGKEDAYLAKLILTYADGTKKIIDTDTTWKTKEAAAMQKGTGIFDGERYDARVDQSWMLPGYDDSAWGSAKINTEFAGQVCAWDGVTVSVRDELELAAKEIYVYDGVTGAASGYYGTVNRVRTYENGDAIALNPGETLVVDFGQNFAGWEAFTLQAEAGTTIEVTHGEMRNEGNGAISRGNDGPEGSIYNANYNWATANTIYIAAGGERETYHPTHTYYGFRYIEITADKPVSFYAISGQVLTSAQEDTGFMTTSDEAVNQLISNIRWGMYSNYLSIPTDCPQRSERQGWTGDTGNFAEAGCYMGFSKSFLEKFMLDMRDSQRADGAYPSTAPKGILNGSTFGAVGWADAGILVPYILYGMYGDVSTIEENWESMEKFMTYRANNGIDRTLGPGDWLAYESNDNTIKQMLDVSYYAWSAQMMSVMAAAIGETEAAEAYGQVYEAQKAYYQSLYVQEDGTLIRSEQSVCLYALYLDLLPSAESVAAVTGQLIANIQRNGNQLQTGFLGTAIINSALSKAGRTDVAYTLLLQHDDPSWLYSVDQGATTIWERWNSYTLANGFGPVSMNSFNHYSFGSVAAWMFRDMAGIGWDAENPGFKHILLTPQPDRSLPEINAVYRSAYGEIVSAMAYADHIWTYEATIPANTTATVKIPVEAADCVITVNGKAPEALNLAEDGIAFVGTEGSTLVFEAVACSFRVRSERNSKGVALDEANAALEKLAAYQSTVSVTADNAELVRTLIDQAEAAVAAYIAQGGQTGDLTGYGNISGADLAVHTRMGMETDTYTIDFDFTLLESAQGFSFGMKDANTFVMWQINAKRNENGDHGILLRPHFRTNGAWTGYPGQSGYIVKAVDVTEAIGYDTTNIIGQTIHERIQVSGNVIKTYFGPDAAHLTLADTYTHTSTIPLHNVGYRHNTSSGDGAETAVYDNIVIRDGNGRVIYEEDFSAPENVLVTGSNNTYYTLENGVMTVGTKQTVSNQIYILGKTVDPVEAAAQVDALIDAIDLSDGDTIAAARSAYDALPETVQKMVTGLADLEAAELAYGVTNTPVALTVTGPELVYAYDETATYTVSAKDMTDLATVLLTFELPTALLAEPVAESCGDWYIISQIWQDGKFRVAAAHNGGADGEGDLLTIKMKTRGESGAAAVSVSQALLASYLGEGETFVPADLTAASAATMILGSPFDVNRDGIVNQLDMTRAQRFFGTADKTADVNADGEVNTADLILILNNYHDRFAGEAS